MYFVGFRDLGQASAQLKTVWHLHIPSSSAIRASRSFIVESRVSRMNRAALRSAAGPG